MGSTRSTRRLRRRRSGKMVDWLYDTVTMAFFPLIFSMVISLCRTGTIDFNRLLGDGELILSAFLISIPAINQCPLDWKGLHRLLQLISFLQLGAYTAIKTNDMNKPVVVYITSALCVISSVIISGVGEMIFERRNSDE